jgi:hypothetical protein
MNWPHTGRGLKYFMRLGPIGFAYSGEFGKYRGQRPRLHFQLEHCAATI